MSNKPKVELVRDEQVVAVTLANTSAFLTLSGGKITVEVRRRNKLLSEDNDMTIEEFHELATAVLNTANQMRAKKWRR